MLYGAGEIKSDHIAQWLIKGSTTVESARRYFFVMFACPVKYGFEKITCLAMIALEGMTSAIADQMRVVVISFNKLL
jgi:hypothetical protein